MRTGRARHIRGAASVTSALALAGLLTGCVAGVDQSSWATGLERLDGVITVDHEHIDHALVQPPEDKATVQLADDLTEAQMADIVEASCASNAYFTELTLVAPGDDDAGAVTFGEATSYGEGCLAIETLSAFAAATAAMRELRPAYDGDFDLFGLTSVRDQEALKVSEPTDTVVIVTTSTEKALLLTALRTLRAQQGATPLEYFGWFDDDDDRSTPSTEGIDARLTGDSDFAALDPLLAAAIDLGATEIAARDRTIDITVPAHVSTDAQNLIAQAAAAEIILTVAAAP